MATPSEPGGTALLGLVAAGRVLVLFCTRPPSAPWKGQKSTLVHDVCDVLLWGAYGLFLIAAGLDRDKHGSMWEQGQGDGSVAVQSCFQRSRSVTASEAKRSILSSPGMQGLQLPRWSSRVIRMDDTFSVPGERTHVPTLPPHLSNVPKMVWVQGVISWRQCLTRRNDGRCF